MKQWMKNTLGALTAGALVWALGACASGPSEVPRAKRAEVVPIARPSAEEVEKLLQVPSPDWRGTRSFI